MILNGILNWFTNVDKNKKNVNVNDKFNFI